MDILLNDELRLFYPGEFHEMTNEEMDDLTFLEGGSCVCLTAPERHIIVSAGWKQPGMMAAILLSSKDIAKKTEKAVSRAMRNVGYRREGFVKRQIAGIEAAGFRYVYSANETNMVGESYAMKISKTIYYLNFYARESLREESFKVWEEMLDSVQKII